VTLNRSSLKSIAIGRGSYASRHDYADRSMDRLRRSGAHVKNLSHGATFESPDKDAPSKAGTKHLENEIDICQQL
jgi:hypothetical protein